MNPQIQPSGPYTDAEALDLLMQYRDNPAELACPTHGCSGETMEVLAFIKPEIDQNGFATVTEPEGDYAAALYCHTCKKAIGILASAMNGF